MGFEPITNCRECDDALDVYHAFEDRFCECCTERLLSDGTEHFRIEPLPWQDGYCIQPKHERTSQSPALIPMPASAKTAAALLHHLVKTEEWYSVNRKIVEGRAA